VPLPWSGTQAPFGFGGPAGHPWLPQPERWAALTVQAQELDRSSTLWLYRSALAERRANPALGDGTFTWDDTPADVLSFTRDPGFRCMVNLSENPVPIPSGAEIILASAEISGATVGTDVAVWLRL
jgi:alpha-glucosidase